MVGDAGDHAVHIRSIADGGARAMLRQHHRDQPAGVGGIVDAEWRIQMRPGFAPEARVPAEIALLHLEEAITPAGNPLHLRRAVDRQPENPPILVILQPDGRSGDPGILLGPHLMQIAVHVRLVHRGQAHVHAHRGIGAVHEFDMGRCGRVQSGRGVQPGDHLAVRHVDRRRLELLQARACELDRQRPVEVGRPDIFEAPVTEPGAVQPIDLAPDAGAHDHVVERAKDGQLVAEGVTCSRVDQRRLRFDSEAVQQGQQQGRLGLAVAEPAAPGEVRGRGCVASEVQQQGHVTDVVLDQAQRHLGAELGISGCGPDALDLRSQRRVGSQRRCLAIKWRHQAGHLGPIVELADF